MTLMWMGLLLVILIGAWLHALNTKYDGVGDFYYVTLGKEEAAGRITLRLECSDSSKCFSLVLISNGLENVLDMNLDTECDPSTIHLGYTTGKQFYSGMMKDLHKRIKKHKHIPLMEERLLITHDLIALIYRQHSSMCITDQNNFKVGYRAARRLKALGRTS